MLLHIHIPVSSLLREWKNELDFREPNPRTAEHICLRPTGAAGTGTGAFLKRGNASIYLSHRKKQANRENTRQAASEREEEEEGKGAPERKGERHGSFDSAVVWGVLQKRKGRRRRPRPQIIIIIIIIRKK
jgi:hypothetical protein